MFHNAIKVENSSLKEMKRMKERWKELPVMHIYTGAGTFYAIVLVLGVKSFEFSWIRIFMFLSSFHLIHCIVF